MSSSITLSSSLRFSWSILDLHLKQGPIPSSNSSFITLLPQIGHTPICSSRHDSQIPWVSDLSSNGDLKPITFLHQAQILIINYSRLGSRACMENMVVLHQAGMLAYPHLHGAQVTLPCCPTLHTSPKTQPHAWHPQNAINSVLVERSEARTTVIINPPSLVLDSQ